MEMSLARLENGVWATVREMEISAALRDRLGDFGLIPGTRVRCRYRSPGGDVTALEFRGTVVALRTRDLVGIQVTEL